jgi:hypothetical protein
MFKPHTHFMHYGDASTTYPQGRAIGAVAAPPRPASQRTVSGQAVGLVNVAFTPVRWAFKETGNLAHWLGSTLQKVGSKL